MPPLSRRERILVALAVVLGPLLIGHSLFVDPQSTRLKGMQNHPGHRGGDRHPFAGRSKQTCNNNWPSTRMPAAKPTWQPCIAERDRLDGQLRQFSTVLVRPEEMNGLLDGLLVRNAGLRLVSLKTLAPQSVLPVVDAKDSPAKPAERSFDLYRHGVEIRLEGSYGQLQAYLAQLEKLQQKAAVGQAGIPGDRLSQGRTHADCLYPES